MVSHPTVLVIGAGASIPYGYPSGSRLVEEIVRGLQTPHASTLGRVLVSFGCGVPELKKFSHELKHSGLNSVDAFLGIRNEWVEIGKITIAAALIPYESRDLFAPQIDGDWYRYLSNQLNQNLVQGRNGPLTILTFNYDRSLEHYLYSSFLYSWGMDGEQLRPKFSKLNICHLHGTLSPHPYFAANQADAREYGKDLTELEMKQAIAAASKEIRIIHETEDKDKVFASAVDTMRQAQHICFLGFGYHPTNVRRLVAGVFMEKNYPGRTIGSALDKTSSEKDAILEQFLGSIQLGQAGMDCLTFLRENSAVIR